MSAVEQVSNPDAADWLKRMQEIGIRVKHIRSSQRGRSAGMPDIDVNLFETKLANISWRCVERE